MRSSVLSMLLMFGIALARKQGVFVQRYAGPAFIQSYGARMRYAKMSISLDAGVQPELTNNVVSSTKSNTVKKVQAILNKRKKRVEFGQTIVEGPRMIFDMLENSKTASFVRQILVSTTEFEELYRDRLYSCTSNSASHAPKIQLVTPEVLKACSDTVTPQGIVALVDIPDFDEIADAYMGRDHPLCLVLDGVSDPGNMGTLLRSSLAVGVSGVILLPGSCDIWNPKAVRSAMGASFQLPILETASWEEAKDKLRNNWNVETAYAATMIEECSRSGTQGSQCHFEVDWLAEPIALVIGSEGNGLSLGVRTALANQEDTNTRAVHVPMQAGIESLNAAVCGSIIMFEYARQCYKDT